MKVLKVGKIPTEQLTCPYCKSELEYEDSDITKQNYCYQGGKCGKHTGYKELITCPVCNTTITVGERETGFVSSFAIREAAKHGVFL